MTDIPSRDQIKTGTKVGIETKKDQGTEKISIGIVKNILTKSNSHPHGIKVELEDGQVGRVKELLGNTGDVITTRDYEIDGPGLEYETGSKITINETSTSPKFTNIDTSIPKNENEYNEFKSTFQYDLEEEQLRLNGNVVAADGRKKDSKHKKIAIRKEIAIAITALANKEGGRLFIGVNDDSSVLGLDRDLKECGGTSEKLGRSITEYLKMTLKDNSFVTGLKLEFEINDDKQYLVIHIPRATNAIFIHFNEKEDFYVRMQNTSQLFTGGELLKYCKDHFTN